MSFEAAKSIQGLPQSEFTLRQLIWSDYCAHYHYKHEPKRKRSMMFLPRMLTNSSLHGAVLIRLSTETPVWMWWFWRRISITLHTCDVLPDVRFGPGLRCPHPHGICMNFVVGGRDVVLQHAISVTTVTNWRRRGWPGLVQIGDGVIIYPGAVVAGKVAIGDGAVIGANTLVTEDVPAHHMVTPRGIRPLKAHERYSP